MGSGCTRRSLLAGLGGLGARHAPAEGGIDRRTLVRRHNPALSGFAPLSPLSVGNGEFAFTAEASGLQTFAELHAQAVPLCTQAQWGWHSYPPLKGLGDADLRLERFDTYGRQVGYRTSAKGQEELFRWLRENPHRLHLGRIGLMLKRGRGEAARAEDLSEVRQRLDLWTGLLGSAFRLEGAPVSVETGCHPAQDLLAVRIRSPLIGQGRLGVVFEFPYGSPEMSAADWRRLAAHRSTVRARSPGRLDIARQLDSDSYWVSIGWEGAGEVRQEGPHRFALYPSGGGERLAFVCLFSRRAEPASLPGAERVFAASGEHWAQFWSGGGAIELEGSRDGRVAGGRGDDGRRLAGRPEDAGAGVSRRGVGGALRRSGDVVVIAAPRGLT